MAAVSALGIDNLFVEVDAEEIPAADGSAKPFVELLYSAGRVSLPAPRPQLTITDPIRVGDESRWLQILPSDSLRISYTLDNRHPVIGLQMVTLAVTEASFVEEVAAARTYGFLRDVPMMRQNGLARGGSLDNAIVVGKRIVLNDSLRFADEFVRHKVLDLVGDLAVLGRPVLGHVVGRNAGHALNHQLVVAIHEACVAERRRRACGPERAARSATEATARQQTARRYRRHRRRSGGAPSEALGASRRPLVRASEALQDTPSLRVTSERLAAPRMSERPQPRRSARKHRGRSRKFHRALQVRSV